MEVQNTRTGATTTISTGSAALSVAGGGDGDGIALLRTVDDPVNGEYVLRSADIVSDDSTSPSSADIGLQLGNNGERYIPVQGASGSTAQISDGDTFTVAGDSGTIDAGSESIDVNIGDEIQFEIVSNDEIRLVNQETGSSLTVDPFGSNPIGATPDSGTIQLENSEVTLDLALDGLGDGDFDSGSVPAGSSPQYYLVNGGYEAGGGGVSEVNIIAIKGSGADQINLEASTITTIGPSGTNTLTYGGTSATQGETFGVQAVQDEDDSIPVMTDADRFEITIDPGTLETGETMTLELTTESGATTEIRISVPNTLSGETAVQV
ncbi:hypothetical protein [Haloarcula sp. 1CSR25-25]|uniref:hypothetical protein n=1 Tax=Haloarcula sp. 1CSR25-25 TaxID=2862545 RepID=UPI0037BE225D